MMPEFINPNYLWALPAGLIPIIIYYLMRFRSLRVRWGATYVLERALEKLRKKFYWDQLLLIFLRVLACVLIVLAFARPTSGKSTFAASGAHRVLLVDGSYSMLATETGRSRWEVCKEAMTKLAGTWSRGQVWSVLMLTDKADWVVDGEAASTPERTVAQMKNIAPGEFAVNLAQGFDEISAKFPTGGIEVYVFADDQAQSWQGVEQFELPPDTAVYWLNPSGQKPKYPNLAVTAVRVANERVLIQHPDRVFVKVRNFSVAPVKNIDVELLVDGSFFAKESVSLLGGQESKIHFDVSFDQAGSHYVTANIRQNRQDILEFDNRFSAGVDVREHFRVLVLRDPARAGVRSAGAGKLLWDFLEIVGRLPGMKDEDDESVFTWGALEFSLYDQRGAVPAELDCDVIVLDGSRTVTRELVESLRDHVRRGRGLVLMADPNVNSELWNKEFSRAGLLPAPLVRLRLEKLGGTRCQRLSRSGLDLGGLGGFEGAENGDLGKSKFYAWYEFGEPAAGVKVLARFTDNQPFLLEKRSAPGNVLLMSGGLNGNYNNLMVREFSLPFIFRLLSQAANGRIFPRTVAKGAPIRLRLDAPATLKAITFNLKGQEPMPLQAQEIISVPAGAPVSGLCSMLLIESNASNRVWYGVQGPRLDSDLTPMTPETHKKLLTELGFVEVPDWAGLDNVLRQERAGREWHHWIIIVLLAAFIGEMLLQRRFV